MLFFLCQCRYSPKQLEASDTRNFARTKDASVENLVHDYANVHISKNYDSLVAMEAQRKVSAAVVSSRERRNSFREAVQSEPAKPSVWVKGGEGGGEGSPHYANLQPRLVQPSQQPVQYFDDQAPPQGYEPVNFKDGKLQSVSLVSDVMRGGGGSRGGGQHYEGQHVSASSG